MSLAQGTPPTDNSLAQVSPDDVNIIGKGKGKIEEGSEKYKQLLTFIDELYTKSRSGRLNFERQWYTNLAFYGGKQYVQWLASRSGPNDRLYEPPAPPWRVRLISNKIKGTVRKELSKVTKEHPMGYVIPSSSDEEDLLAARAGDMVYEHEWRELGGNKIVRRAVFWELICGTSFIKDGYDPVRIAPDGSIGDIVLEALSPFHVLVPDIKEEELENQFCIIHAMTKDPEWVLSKFGVNVKGSTSGSGGDGVVDGRFLSAMGIKSQDSREKVLLKEMWIKPGNTSKWPNGLIVVWTDEGKIIYAQDQWPYLHTEYPFSKLEHIPTGRFYGDSTINDLIPLQKEYNRSRSQIIEAKNRMSKPQLLAQKGSIEPKKITSEPGLIIQYTPGFIAPTPLPLQNLPSYVFEHLRELKEDWSEISSQHELPHTSTAAASATAISFLQEEDDSVLAPTITSLEEAVEKVGKHILQHVQMHWQAERQVRVVGINSQFETMMFTNSALKGNTDFVIQAGSATPRSRAAKQAFIMEIGKLGWIPPEHALRFLDMTETGRLYEELQIDVRQAQRENLLMTQPSDPAFLQTIQQPAHDPQTGAEQMPVLPVPINNYDNDTVHLATHQTFQKSQSYNVLDPGIKAIFAMHCEFHKLRIAEKLGIYGLKPYDPRLDAIVSGNAHVIGQLLGMGVQVDSQQQGQGTAPPQGQVG